MQKKTMFSAFAAAAFAFPIAVAGQTEVTSQATADPPSVAKTHPVENRSTSSEPTAVTVSPVAVKRDEPAIVKKQTVTKNGWEFEVTPYVFASGLRGTVGARGRTLDVDSSFFDIFHNLKGFLMGKFDVRKGRFVSTNDLMWIKLSADAENPGRLYNTTDVGVNLFIFDPEAGYRVYQTGHSSVDVLGGVRIWSVETNLRTTSGILTGFDVSQRKSWAAPVIGVRGTTDVGRNFFLEGKFDIGGAGIGADLTTQVYAGGGYRFTKHFSLVGGFRWLQVDYDDSSGFLFDTHMTGLQLGAKFNF